MGKIKVSAAFALAVVSLGAVALTADFSWSWRNQEVIGRTDISLNNTSRLTEPERGTLLDAIVLRLQKPMSERGYDDERIREIASTTRLRFLDLGEGRAVIMATSLGLEGGCDALANCPFWIFRRAKDGYVSLLDTVAASYTIQPTSTNGFSDLVMLRYLSAGNGRLTLYQYADGKYAEAGCYTAAWAAPKDSELQEPALAPCQSEQPK